MPLTEGDVLDTLSDPAALGIEFYVDKIHIKGEYLTTVRDHIRAGNILVKADSTRLNEQPDSPKPISTPAPRSSDSGVAE